MIWLIGNKGMLGSDVEAELRANNIDYIASDKEVDITEMGALKSFADNKNISWIINCSAYTAVDKAEDEIEMAVKVNSDGVYNIAVLAKEMQAKLIHISTDYVFNGMKQGAYVEDDLTDPQGAYGKTKLLGELAVINECPHYFIFRISWLYGRQGNNFVNTMLRLFKERDELKVVSDQWGSPTYTGDFAAFLIEVIKQDASHYGIYHYSNEGRTNWCEFAREIYRQVKDKKIIGKDVLIHAITTGEYPTKAKRPANSYMAKEKVKCTFNITIRNWQEALQDFLNEM